MLEITELQALCNDQQEQIKSLLAQIETLKGFQRGSQAEVNSLRAANLGLTQRVNRLQASYSSEVSNVRYLRQQSQQLENDTRRKNDVIESLRDEIQSLENHLRAERSGN